MEETETIEKGREWRLWEKYVETLIHFVMYSRVRMGSAPGVRVQEGCWFDMNYSPNFNVLSELHRIRREYQQNRVGSMVADLMSEEFHCVLYLGEIPVEWWKIALVCVSDSLAEKPACREDLDENISKAYSKARDLIEGLTHDYDSYPLRRILSQDRSLAREIRLRIFPRNAREVIILSSIFGNQGNADNAITGMVNFVQIPLLHPLTIETRFCFATDAFVAHLKENVVMRTINPNHLTKSAGEDDPIVMSEETMVFAKALRERACQDPDPFVCLQLARSSVENQPKERNLENALNPHRLALQATFTSVDSNSLNFLGYERCGDGKIVKTTSLRDLMEQLKNRKKS